MKKLLIIGIIVAFFASPYFLPIPLVTSATHSQYALGDNMTIDLTAWNVSPLAREFTTEHATDIVLKIDGVAIVNTTTDVAPKVMQFSRVSQTVDYKISKKEVTEVHYNEVANEIEIPEGRHKISVEWLGSSSFSKEIAFIRI